MKPEAIKAYIHKHYELLFEGKKTCRLPIEKGKHLAQALGYSPHLIGLLAEEFWDGFVPCGNPQPYLKPAQGDKILNLGCGIGIDSLETALKHGSEVGLVNLDIVFSILKRGRRLALQSGICTESLRWICSDGENLPFKNESFEWIITNGVFNLFPDKPALIKEFYRVLKISGFWVNVDLCCVDSLPDYFYREPDAWAWCMSGACTEDHLAGILKKGGFDSVRMNHQEKGDWFDRVIFSCRKDSG